MLLHMKEPVPPSVAPDEHVPGAYYRACPKHRLELLDQPDGPETINCWCPGGHVLQMGGHDEPVEWWVIARDTGQRVAICTRESIRWEEWFLDAARTIAGRNEDGVLPRLANLRDEDEDRRERRKSIKRDSRQRMLERDRAEREGRQPAKWAAHRSAPKKTRRPRKKRPVFVPLHLREKPAGAIVGRMDAYRARKMARAAGVQPPEWAKARKPGVGRWQPGGGNGAAA
jgi:hypothetical protein